MAIDDLKTIHSYIAKDSKVYADRFVEKLISKIDQLENFPLSGKMVPEFGQESIRELIEGSYRIVYKINPDHVGIARVHHTSQLLKIIN